MQSLLKAKEIRELGKQLLTFLNFIYKERLSHIKMENEKILKELEDISKGKKLNVGHH